MDEILRKLREIAELLQKGGETRYAEQIEEVLRGTEVDLKAYLTSNELWGGSGSIADQALLYTRGSRRTIEKLLIELGELQMNKGIVNVRIAMWTGAFKEWQRRDT